MALLGTNCIVALLVVIFATVFAVEDSTTLLQVKVTELGQRQSAGAFHHQLAVPDEIHVAKVLFQSASSVGLRYTSSDAEEGARLYVEFLQKSQMELRPGKAYNKAKETCQAWEKDTGSSCGLTLSQFAVGTIQGIFDIANGDTMAGLKGITATALGIVALKFPVVGILSPIVLSLFDSQTENPEEALKREILGKAEKMMTGKLLQYELGERRAEYQAAAASLEWVPDMLGSLQHEQKNTILSYLLMIQHDVSVLSLKIRTNGKFAANLKWLDHVFQYSLLPTGTYTMVLEFSLLAEIAEIDASFKDDIVDQYEKLLYGEDSWPQYFERAVPMAKEVVKASIYGGSSYLDPGHRSSQIWEHHPDGQYVGNPIVWHTFHHEAVQVRFPKLCKYSNGNTKSLFMDQVDAANAAGCVIKEIYHSGEFDRNDPLLRWCKNSLVEDLMAPNFCNYTHKELLFNNTMDKINEFDDISAKQIRDVRQVVASFQANVVLDGYGGSACKGGANHPGVFEVKADTDAKGNSWCSSKKKFNAADQIKGVSFKIHDRDVEGCLGLTHRARSQFGYAYLRYFDLDFLICVRKNGNFQAMFHAPRSGVAFPLQTVYTGRAPENSVHSIEINEQDRVEFAVDGKVYHTSTHRIYYPLNVAGDGWKAGPIIFHAVTYVKRTDPATPDAVALDGYCEKNAWSNKPGMLLANDMEGNKYCESSTTFDATDEIKGVSFRCGSIESQFAGITSRGFKQKLSALPRYWDIEFMIGCQHTGTPVARVLDRPGTKTPMTTAYVGDRTKREQYENDVHSILINKKGEVEFALNGKVYYTSTHTVQYPWHFAADVHHVKNVQPAFSDITYLRWSLD